jgi:23S rRNA (cytidine2498-2'-O)-methyltransferase
MSARFVFAVCQAGAERALKNDVAHRQPGLRSAFSRPGFVTFRLPESADDTAAVQSAFARTWGSSLGKATGADDAARAREAWRLVAAELPPERLAEFRHLHVWQRGRLLPGDEGFDATQLAAAQTAGAALLALWSGNGARAPLALNATARAGELVLDCVLVEPEEWWLGWHRAGSMETRWPGGVPPLVAPRRLLSRTYLKIQEALLWSELPVEEGDRCVEIGSSPGGSCLALLERGCIVTGIDPAEMDPLVLAQPHFTHLRAKAKDVKRSVFRDCRWLIMDANVAPKYTLDTIEALVTQPRVRPEGLLLTLKLTDPALAAQLPAFEKRIRALGYGRIRMRQLAFNRQEVCAVVTDRSTH